MQLYEAEHIGIRIGEAVKDIEKANMLPRSFLAQNSFQFDFSNGNREVVEMDMTKCEVLQGYIAMVLREAETSWGYGGYGEERSWYTSPLFTSDGEARTVHLGIDIWLPPGTPVYLSITGVVHSFQNNQDFLDYGPTIIIEHQISGTHFFTLYGHLNVDSLKHLTVGSAISAGGEVGRVGEESENGSWAPHLHFQIIGDMLGKRGDFPGVARQSEKDLYLALCPNPGLLFRV